MAVVLHPDLDCTIASVFSSLFLAFDLSEEPYRIDFLCRLLTSDALLFTFCAAGVVDPRMEALLYAKSRLLICPSLLKLQLQPRSLNCLL